MVAALAKVPVRIAHFRSDGIGGRGGGRRRIVLAISRALIEKFATRIIGVAPSALESGWRADWRRDPRCFIIANGIDASRLRNLSATSRSTRPTPESELVVANIGRIEPSKNRARAIRIWQELASKRPSTLYLVGELNARDRSQLVETAKVILKASRIVEVGDTSDVTSYLGRSHVLLVTSMREGLPGVVLESLAVGVPVVGSQLPGIEWIGSRAEGVTVLPLEATDQEWAHAVWTASATNSSTIRQSFDNGPFLLEKSTREFEVLWSVNQRHGSA
ncbi:MAG: glycosyltransferase [Cryobacterium sp.]|nr:glycosyltransferase [Cryobacterium sp.]